MEKNSKRIWISSEIFYWDSSSTGGTVLSQEPISRAYSIWEHAKTLIEGNNSKFALADGVTNLKRSYNHRLNHIETLYSFRIINIKNKPKGYLELLESFQIVRPYIMDNLRLIRNAIEHNDAPPPDINRCKELLDVVWYFLKSTDKLVQLLQETCFELENEDSHGEAKYWFEPTINYGNPFSILIRGNFPRDLVSYEEKIGFFMIDKKNPISEEQKRFPFHIKEYGSCFSIFGPVKLETIEIEKLVSKVITAY
ncbi:hypothetical protein QTL97_16970 [Sporosarcina thermotolerans]|uniref:DUF4145 domain-containing protein n=1 Tax=Sporosarcina thermotolerans TaxID=633404 RepID=A0AAW9AE59_9BACL|nr:hypothetical protein [Sporosarcina thermotolerans]MDW0118620.1 hypothetical protein [Sporosarcina thermotolerans]WHT49586.1 hypothetical protein QNH10_08815 [Sporosarcina thermotolerans]